ncbi:MAG: hypothetical protein MUF07_04860 [Steroidobacteraceae bacterium]|jgi:hypothetical protein|nr:hypothetical protein [Steroidobacteraceae bacterium]
MLRGHDAPAPPKRVLVTGAGHGGGRAALGALRCRGYEVIACDTECLEAESPWFARIPTPSEPGFLSTLTRVAQEREASWLLPTLPGELPRIAGHAATLRRLGIAVHVPPPRTVAICGDAWQTTMWLAAHGIAVPRSTLADPAEHAALGLRSPVVARRRIAPDDDPAPALLDDVLWQESLSGEAFRVLLVMDPQRPSLALYCRALAGVTAQHGRALSAATAYVAPRPEVTTLAIKACSALGVTGPATVDVRCDATGQPHVTRVHAHVGPVFGLLPGIFDRLVALHLAGVLG